MVTVAIGGGLGNQMFQYAAARALAWRQGSELQLDPLELLDPMKRRYAMKRPYDLPYVFNIDPKLVWPARIFRKFKVPYLPAIIGKGYGEALGMLGVWKYVHHEGFMTFYPEILTLKGDVYLDGGWMTEKYFEDCKDIIRNDFTFRDKLTDASDELQKEIESVTSVALHVRRGDRAWVQSSTAPFYIMGTQEYYDKCLAILREKIGKNFKLFIFSDSVDWCRDNLKFAEPHTFVGDEYAGPHAAHHFQLMSSCKHFAIPESSFSWWAAWLAKNPEKVIVVPKKLYVDETVDTRYAHPTTWIEI